MRTLHSYLVRQTLQTLLLTVAVFTLVLLLGNVLKEIMALLVSRQVTFGLVLKAIGLLIPYVMAYVLPFGMLTATLLVFGRFSADHELTAVRASGISLVSLVTPVLLLGVAMSCLCALVNTQIAPTCRQAYKQLIYDLMLQKTSTLITEDRFIDEIPGIVFYSREKQGDNLAEVRLYVLEAGDIKRRITAPGGSVVWNHPEQTITFHLTNGVAEYKREERASGTNAATSAESGLEVKWDAAAFREMDYGPVDLTTLLQGPRKPKLSEMTFLELRQEIGELESKGIPTTPAQVQLHRQISFSFACIAFTLIGIPLAIQTQRRETSIGVAISLGLVMAYYGFFVFAEGFQNHEEFAPQLILWIPNLVFQTVGAALLWRANRRG